MTNGTTTVRTAIQRSEIASASHYVGAWFSAVDGRMDAISRETDRRSGIQAGFTRVRSFRETKQRCAHAQRARAAQMNLLPD